jgi:hypothetical protein
MNTHTITKNGVVIEIEQNADQHGQLDVIARHGNKSQRGKIPGNIRTLYPRIEFRFCEKSQWLHELADSRSWSVDDYETDDDLKRRPTDNCEFILTPDEVIFLNGWRVLKNTPKPAPTSSAHRWQSMDIDSGLGIGGINNDQSMPIIPSVRAIERVQKMHDTDTICRKCGASKNFDGAMFTTLSGSDICDDCA